MTKNKLLLLLALLLTAATGAWAQTSMIKGLFSVSATKKVHFSKGNLQYDGTNWKFAASQWEVLGANGTGTTGTATNYPMDLFTWGNIDSPTYNGTTYYTGNADLSGITDWGSRMGSGWYTLSKDEWLYLFGMESSKTDKSGHARYRKYFRATVNGVTGIVVLPDDLSGISDIPAESSRGTASTFNGKTYTTDAWSAMESAGCVFLPTAGFRKTDTTVSHVGVNGFYWASTAYDAGKAHTLGFDWTVVDPANNFDRTFGFSVRLVIDQYYLTMKDGVKDADKWTVKVGEGQAQALPIGGLKGDGSETVTLQYNGRLKVKGVKATSDAAPAKTPATVTTAPTGAAIVGVGKTTALVSGGVADGSTLMYKVTTTNTKPTSTAGFSASVPTAKDITASGTVYVWYYVKGDDTHTDSEIAATPIEVPVADIVWDVTNISDLQVSGTFLSYTKEGVTLSAKADEIEARWRDHGDESGIYFEMDESGGYTFTAPTGQKFTKIEMTLNGSIGWENASLGTGWAFVVDYMNQICKVTWTGSSAASPVGLLTGADHFDGDRVKSIAFYLSE